jgi:hypothetical protein
VYSIPSITRKACRCLTALAIIVGVKPHSTRIVASRFAAFVLAVAAIVPGVALVSAGDASAGTNGQHVALAARVGANLNSVKLSGYNENGDYKEQFLDLTENSTHTYYEATSYWWWKTYQGKRLQIDWFNGFGQRNYVRSTYCDVPVSYWKDTFTCNA